jgi:hypothetical protein
MNSIDVLIRLGILLLQEKNTYNKVISRGLAERILKFTNSKNNKLLNGEAELLGKLRLFIEQILETDITDLPSYVDTFLMLLSEKPKLYDLVVKQIENKIDENGCFYL